MKIADAIPCLLLSMSLLSCGEKEPGGSSGGAGGGGSSCLAKYDNNIGDVLTKERLAGLVDISGVEPKQEIMPKGMVKNVTWSWPSDRIRIITIGGNEMEVPVQNTVRVSSLKVLDNEKYGPKDGKTYVEQNYRSISEEEMKEIEANMQKSLDEKVKKGELTEEQAKMAGGLGGGLMGKERIVETIENVGDACRWTASDNLLAVGHRNVFFSITVDVSADSAVNREKAIALAKTILAECE